MKTKIKKALIGYAFLAPNAFAFLLFMLFPLIFSFALIFFKWDIVTPAKFVGFQNIAKLLSDKSFWYYFYNTVYLMLGIPLGMVGSLLLALLVNIPLKGITIFRTIYFLPCVVPLVASAMLWRWIYNPDFGLLNAFLRFVGIIDPPKWLSSVVWAKPAFIFMSIWGIGGFNMLLYLAALQSIPEELYEAAKVDGASAWQRFWHITLPNLSFVNFFVIIMGIIGGFQAFGAQYVMTGGGPAGSTTTIVYYIYNNAYQWFKMGYACTVAWFLFFIILIFTIFQWKLTKGGRFHYQ